jgi:hypothetical protein
MRTVALLAAVGGLLVLPACASSRSNGPKGDGPATPVAPATSLPPAPEPPATPATAAVTPPAPALPTGPRLPGPFSPPGGLPIVAPGEARTQADGCLTLANPETEGPTRAPAVAHTRGGGDGPEVGVKQTPAGITVTHALHHNCCQKADVQTNVADGKVTITETFTGNTCRCNCQSTLTTTVGLKPGAYAIEVVRVEGGPPKTIYSGNVTIQSLLGPKIK